MTKVFETQTSMWELELEPQEVIARAVALGWEVVEEPEGRTIMMHPLIPGATRVVHR